MDKEKLSWGLILLFVGSILLLDNLDVIDFYWRSVFNMWPIILIVVGVNLMVPKRGIGSAVSIVVTMAALAFLAYRGTFHPRSNWWSFGERGWDTETENSTDRANRQKKSSSGTFTHAYDSAIDTAHLTIKGGAVAYEINGTTDELFHAEAASTIGTHQLESTTNGPTTDLTFQMRDTKKGKWNGGDNWAKISLNTSPAWHINLDMGAGSAKFDLTEYKVASLRFKGGAASFQAKMGQPLSESTITAESGVASVEIQVPKNAACRIVVKSDLSSRDFPGFTKREDGSYVTEGYGAASNRFTINLQGGLTSFTVKRY